MTYFDEEGQQGSQPLVSLCDEIRRGVLTALSGSNHLKRDEGLARGLEFMLDGLQDE